MKSKETNNRRVDITEYYGEIRRKEHIQKYQGTFKIQDRKKKAIQEVKKKEQYIT